jgi:hypothetical protein
MIDELERTLEEFAGDASRIRCFLHIVNLVAKSMLKQFDVPKKGPNDGLEGSSNTLDDQLRDLAEGIELEEEMTLAADEGDEDEDDTCEWVDEVARLSSGERKTAEDQIRPIRFVLVKASHTLLIQQWLLTLLVLQIRKLAFKIINSTTIVLPIWHQILEALKLDSRIMPRDVSTRWNSTFDMLDFAIKYRSAIDKITADRNTDLRKFELNDAEWEIARQLRDTLKVRFSF